MGIWGWPWGSKRKGCVLRGAPCPTYVCREGMTSHGGDCKSKAHTTGVVACPGVDLSSHDPKIVWLYPIQIVSDVGRGGGGGKSEDTGHYKRFA